MATGEAYHLKKVVLRMYWDNETDPSVETPIGDFFGLGLGTYTVFQSALVAVAPDKALNAYFPMPFARQGRITVTNEGALEIPDFYWNIDWVRLPALAAKHRLFSCPIPAVRSLQGLVSGKLLQQQLQRSSQGSRDGATLREQATICFWKLRVMVSLWE